MIQHYDKDFENLINLTDTGLDIASFVQIREAIMRRYKLVYGSDIDLSTASADGVFVNDLALLVNNILQSFNKLYSSLNVDTATGKYLDNICEFANLTRKGKTASVVWLRLYNNNSGQDVILNDKLNVVDEAGTTWISENIIGTIPGTYTKLSGSYLSVKFVCTELGPVKADSGSIFQALQSNINAIIDIEQPDDAIEGRAVETDAELRVRRSQSVGQEGSTVLESLLGALLELDAVNDAHIIANNTGASITTDDGLTLPSHDVYVAIRRQSGSDIDESIIGQLIYDKMTPGILTKSATGATSGTAKSYESENVVNGIKYASNIVYWKECTPVKPEIKITLTPNKYYAQTTAAKIGAHVMSYMNAVLIGQTVTEDEFIVEISNQDPGFLSRRTFSISEIKVNNAVADIYKNPITYYNYTSVNITESGSNVVITIA